MHAVVVLMCLCLAGCVSSTSAGSLPVCIVACSVTQTLVSNDGGDGFAPNVGGSVVLTQGGTRTTTTTE